MTINVIFSEWIPAQFSVKDETVFAVGDVHGCGEELGALLSAIEETSAEISHQKRLIFLGDVIDRGPGNIKALKLWAEPAGARGLDKVDRLMGNHEQLLLLAMADSPHSQKAEMMWLSEAIGGSVLLGEMRAAAPGAQEHTYTALFKEALGGRLFDLFTTMASHVEIGNALFVHGGLDPNEDVAEFLSRPWQSFTEAGWAWVHGEFLQWRGGFGGKIVVHGHTPPHMHRELTGQDDPHALAFSRLGLDGGTTRTGIVTGAQIETGRYRILRAGHPSKLQ
ncbi:MAG: hypothetical protein HOB37_17100 [Rhodospirillaceae bacterium]|nr:hypothetical protein [Rhodospirillaceae bacterium]